MVLQVRHSSLFHARQPDCKERGGEYVLVINIIAREGLGMILKRYKRRRIATHLNHVHRNTLSFVRWDIMVVQKLYYVIVSF